MDLETLKAKFKDRSVADIKDINLALRATPFLVREVIRLEEALVDADRRIEHMGGLLRRSPPSEREGQKDEASWKIWTDERKNRLYIQLFGKLEKRSAKLISNAILSVMENLSPGFAVVLDVRKISSDIDSRTLFYFRKTAYAFALVRSHPIVRVMEEGQKMAFLFEPQEGCPPVSRVRDVLRVRSVEEADHLLDNLGRHLRA